MDNARDGVMICGIVIRDRLIVGIDTAVTSCRSEHRTVSRVQSRLPSSACSLPT